MNTQNETVTIKIELDDRNVVRGLQDITRELESLTRESGFATTAIQEISNSLNESDGFLQTAAGNFDAFGVAVGIITGGSEDFKKGIASWFEPLQNLSGGMGNVTDAAGSMAGAKAGLAGTFKALLGPIGLVAGALIIGASLFAAFRNTEDAVEDLGDEAETLRERIDNLSEAIRRNRRAHQENLDAIRTHERLTGSMIDRIRELNDKQRVTGENQRLLSIWVDQFNDAMGETVLTIDRHTGMLDANSQSMVENRIFSRELAFATEKFDEKSRRLSDVLTEQNDILDVMGYKDLAEEIEIAEEAMQRYREEMQETLVTNMDFLESSGFHGDTFFTASRAYRAATEDLERLREEKSDLTDKYERNIEEIANLEAQMQESYISMRNLVADYVEAHGIQYWMLNDTQRDVVHQMLERWTMYRDNGREMFSQLGEATKLFDITTDEHGNRIQTSYRELEKTADEVMQSMINNMSANREATANWSTHLDTLAGRTSDEFAQHMREMGVESAWYVQQMLEGCGDLLQLLYEEFQASGVQAGENLVGSLGDTASDVIPIVEGLANNVSGTLSDSFDAADFGSIGARVVEVTADGLLREGPTAERAAVKSGNYVLRGFEGVFEQGEEQMFQSGRNMFLGFNQGAEEIIPSSCTLAKQAAMEIYEELSGFNEENSPSRLYMRSGRNMILGLIEGIESLQDRPVNRIQIIAQNMHRVYNSSQNEYRITGRHIIDGLRDGLLSREDHLMSAARRIATNMQTTMQRALQINSPSRVMREQIGRFIPEGVAAGIDKYADVAIGSVDKLANDMVKINIPSIESMIGMTPSMKFTTAGGSSTHDNRVSNHHHNYAGLFDGARIEWKGEEDIRRTMEKMARAMEDDSARMW